ncbi:hypothetical protein SAMN05421810_11385 [Amycolatopsis arida]|uniref:Uncharacterized protein n=1 Tax=Amycolatopsis arida TaxID=587909 RepID=A0A1I6AMD8_9PSEU|nr:hypothetical protein CLV69_11385 [Amycolatopsis arida]SFQ69812.1 hypothetical protein SAMN05421810_11385 [Amycolatopsis arida]
MAGDRIVRRRPRTCQCRFSAPERVGRLRCASAPRAPKPLSRRSSPPRSRDRARAREQFVYLSGMATCECGINCCPAPVGLTHWADDYRPHSATRPDRPWRPDLVSPGGRSEVTVYRVPEPATLTSATVTPTTFTLRYPDGPRDAESLLVDPRTNRLYVASKRGSDGTLYQAPSPLRTDQPNVLTPVSAAPAYATDGAYSPDGTSYVLRTGKPFGPRHRARLRHDRLAAGAGHLAQPTAGRVGQLLRPHIATRRLGTRHPGLAGSPPAAGDLPGQADPDRCRSAVTALSVAGHAPSGRRGLAGWNRSGSPVARCSGVGPCSTGSRA